MPLFEVTGSGLVPFRQMKGGAGLYEKEIEELLWANLEDFTGETLFPIDTQVNLPTGGIPDAVALDRAGRVVLFEVKRDVDRRQIAQALEYAGWARSTNLDELAGMYSDGPDAFWSAWLEFTETDTPVVVNPTPRLVLVARDFEARTESAFDFLIEAGVPVSLMRVVVYEDGGGRRFVNVEGEHEPDVTPSGEPGSVPSDTRVDGRRMRVSDLLDAGLLEIGDQLRWVRPRNGMVYTATITESGLIRLPDGSEFTTPSTAAVEAAGVGSFDGWHAWTVVRLDKKLHELRQEYHTAV